MNIPTDQIKLHKRDVKLILYYIIFVVVVLGAYWAVSASRQNFVEKLAEILATAVVIPILFAIFEKMGAALPFERRLQEQQIALNREITTLKDLLRKDFVEHLHDISTHQEQIGAGIRAALDDLEHYEKYQFARMTYGFNSVWGVEVAKVGPDVTKTSVNLPLKVIHDTRRGDRLLYMTTFISGPETYVRELEAAVERGVKIKLLLMLPVPKHAPVILARFTDLTENRRFGGTEERQVENFAIELQVLARHFTELRERLKTTSSLNRGSFELKFYTKSLNFPLLCVEAGDSDDNTHPVAYTGFYAGKSAEDMPYVEWRGGDYRIYRDFKKVFTTKWAACTHDEFE